MTDQRTTRDEDLTVEAAVLQLVLDAFPARVTESEIVRELGENEPSFEERDAIERAVRDLMGIGLVHGHDDCVTPTRAAIRSRDIFGRGP